MSSAIVGVLKVLMVGETAGLEKSFGTAGKLTGEFQGQVGSLGSAFSSLGRVLGPLVTTGAIAAGVQKTIEYAGKISDLAAQTGHSTDSIQQMGHAAKMTGSSMDAFATAAFQLSARLGDGNDSVVGALNRLGLSYEQIRKMSPDDQFRTIADALGRVQDQNERTTLAMDLFGKGAKSILPAIAQGYSQIADEASIAGEMQINALDQTGDALDSFKEGVMSVSVQLAGGFVIAVREAGKLLNNLTGFTRNVSQAMEDWGTILESLGAKSAAALPRVFDEARVKAKLLPEPIHAITLSTQELAAAEADLTAQMKAKTEANKKAIKEQQDLNEAQKRFVDSINNRFYTADFYMPFVKGVQAMSFELEELASTLPAVAQNFVPFKAAVQESSLAVDGWRDHVRTTMEGLPSVIMKAIQGGGSVIGAAGAHIGTSLMSRFQEKFGPAITAALPFGIGAAVNALLPTLGALFGPIAEKIGGFFRSIFGGPSADELRGRQAVADFEAQLHALLSQTQRNEAGNESWKMTVIALRDAYIAQGLTAADAMKAAEKLWASSRSGAAASEAAIAEIKRVLDGVTSSTNTLDAALDSTFVDRSFTVEETRIVNENVYRNFYGEETTEGFATGTMGRLGKWFGDFGASGFATALHGVEAVVTPEQAVPFAMDVLAGAGGGGAAVDMGPLLGEMQSLRRELRDQPRHIAYAVEEAVALRGSRR